MPTQVGIFAALADQVIENVLDADLDRVLIFQRKGWFASYTLLKCIIWIVIYSSVIGTWRNNRR